MSTCASAAEVDHDDVPATHREIVGALLARGFDLAELYGTGPDGTCHCPKGKRCRTPGKHPKGKAWQKQDGLTAAQAAGKPLGIVTGRPLPDGTLLVVVDLDGPDAQEQWLALGGTLDGFTVATAREDGLHLYRKMPPGSTATNSTGTLAKGVDVRAVGGFVVAPGTTLRQYVDKATGAAGDRTYEIHNDDPILEAEPLLADFLTRSRAASTAATTARAATADSLTDAERERAQRYCSSAIRDEMIRLDAMASAAKMDGIGYDGEPWDHTTYAVACNLLEIANTPGSGLTPAEAEQLVLEHAPSDDGFGPDEHRRRIKSARAKIGATARAIPAPPATFPAQREPVQAPPPQSSVTDDDVKTPTGIDSLAGIAEAEFTDGIVAERFATEHRGEIIHVEGIGWLEYKDGRFIPVPAKRVEALALKSARRLVTEVRHRGKGAVRDAAKRLDAPRVRAVEHIARGLDRISVEPDQLDADPYLLNVANGTLDLRTFELHPHDPADHLTKATAAKYDPDADMTAWEDFLEQVLPDSQVRDYLARVVGQALVGIVTEHLFAILTGRGGNGKGTFYTALIDALGSYAQALDPGLLLASDKGPGGPELMRLKGARICVGSETGEGRRLDEATMKRMTGGDRLTARNLYQPPVEWVPSHQLLYVTNHLPAVKGNDPAVWRRVRVIPFTVQVSDEAKDTGLGAKLAENIDAVLLWAAQGYRDYLDGGMCEPDAVLVATDAYRMESDAVSRFIKADCLVSPAASATTRELYTEWQRWQSSEGVDHLSESGFSAELTRLGYEASRTKRGKTWRGLTPHVSAPEDQSDGR